LEHAAPSRMQGLDTLRSLAIIAVMLFHISGRLPDRLASIAQFGWMGVDLFFVLSGYLIGSQLLKPYRSGQQPRLWEFYRRRLYRILPAYLVVLALYFLVPVWREQPGISPLWQFLTFTENLFVDYGSHQAFSHVWSLCVEEHFYLLLPVLALWLSRRASLWKTVSLIAFFVALGIAIRWYELVHVLRPLSLTEEGFGVKYIERIYYPTYTHFDGLLAGVGLALIRIFRPEWWAAASRRGHALFFAGTGLTGLCFWLFLRRFESVTGVEAVGTVAGFPLLSLGLGLLVAASISRNSWLAQVRVPGAKLVATLAFSLYLTHKEVMHLDRQFLPWVENRGLVLTLLVYAVTCLAAAATLYLCVERPFMLLRDRGSERRAARPELEVLREPAL
jgi:peptidoglycan/LPS O-acetylase OafA/YrhL